jgi:hypothetical protein
MASPKVFVSSTCFDLGEVREQLSRFIEQFGFEPVLSENGDVFYHPDLHTHDACIHEVSNCQLFILIIGGRFGGEYIADKTKSITNAEYIAAREKNIPVFTYIRKNVLSDHYFYIENRKEEHASKIKYPNIEKQEHAIDIFNFIDDVRRSPTNNAFESFDTFPDMENHLRKQWAGMFFDFLKSREIKAQIDTTNHLIEGISLTSNKLEDLVKSILKSTIPDNAEQTIEDIDNKVEGENFITLIKNKFRIEKLENLEKDKLYNIELKKYWFEFLEETDNFRVMTEYDIDEDVTDIVLWNSDFSIGYILGEVIEGKNKYKMEQDWEKDVQKAYESFKKLNKEVRNKILEKFI